MTGVEGILVSGKKTLLKGLEQVDTLISQFSGSFIGVATSASYFNLSSITGSINLSGSISSSNAYYGSSYQSSETNLGDTGGVSTIDWNQGNYQHILMTADWNVEFNSPTGVGELTLRIQYQSPAPSSSITWDPDVRWENSVIPTPTGGIDNIDIFKFYYDGTFYYGRVFSNYSVT